MIQTIVPISVQNAEAQIWSRTYMTTKGPKSTIAKPVIDYDTLQARQGYSEQIAVRGRSLPISSATVVKPVVCNSGDGSPPPMCGAFVQ